MFEIILFITIFLSFFLSALAITKKNKTIADTYLSIWLIFLGVQLFFVYMSMDQFSSSALYFKYLGYCFSIPHGAFLYLYTKSLTNQSLFNIKQLIHFIPFLISLSGLFITPNKIIDISTRIFSLLSVSTYIFLSLHIITRHRSIIKDSFSTIDKVNLDWLKHLIYGILLFCICGLIFGVLFNLVDIQIPFNEVFSLLILIFISVLGFKGIKQTPIFSVITSFNINNLQKRKDKKNTYANYGLKNTYAKELASRLRTYMDNEKPYKNMELTLNDISTALNTYPHYITQILNTIFKQNFYEYINSYRLEEVKKELLNSENNNLTILAIAYNCGFNSKSAFNRIFKEKTGLTPSQYRKSVRQ